MAESASADGSLYVELAASRFAATAFQLTTVHQASR
jgi:hypothetical protein